MASSSSSSSSSVTENLHHHFKSNNNNNNNNIAHFINSSLFTNSSSKIFLPLPFSSPPLSSFDSSPMPNNLDSFSSSSSSSSGFPSTMRISNLKSNANGNGPAFVGQVFSMCDLSGTGLMAVSTQFDIPFISKRYRIISETYFLSIEVLGFEL